MKQDIEKCIDKLRGSLNHHNRLYYTEAAPEISDFEYDTLYRELQDLEAKYPEYLTQDSPTLRVGGAPLTSFKSITHAVPMMSLDNTYSHEEIRDLDKMLKRLLGDASFSYILEPKVDGVAFSLRYENGLLVSAGTRGDGIRGDNVTANVRTIKSIPLRIETDAAVIEVRGEVFMDKQKFLELTEKQTAAGKEPFKNPRNATAGSLKQLDSRVVATRPLDAVLYGCGQLEGITFETHEQFLNQLKTWGFPTVDKFWICANIGEVIENIKELEVMRHDFSFEIDGAVVKVNERNLYDTLGSTAKSPRWAKAYKYPPEQMETIVNAITVQVGRTGVLTPVAELEPIFLSGSEISRATLHNAEHIERKDIRVGDHVMIEKAGEVIPAVVSVLKNKRPKTTIKFKMPATCPDCGEPAIKREGEVALCCENLQCPAQTVRLLLHFASRNCLDIEALGNVVAEKLVELEMVKTPLDLFDLNPNKLAMLNFGTRITSIESVDLVLESDITPLQEDAKKRHYFGSDNAKKLLKAVEDTRSLPLDRWLFALGIPRIGKTVSFNIARTHRDLTSVARSTVLSGLINFLETQSKNINRIKDENKKIKSTKISNDIKTPVIKCISKLNKEIQEVAKPLIALNLLDISANKNPVKNVEITYITTSIGSESAKSAIKYFKSKRGLETLRQLNKLGINPKLDNTNADVDLSGNTFVLTGTLTTMKRDEATDAIRAQGGTVTTAVTSKTTYLVAGANTGAKKIEKAQSLNVKVIHEPELVAMLAIEMPTVVTEPKPKKIIQQQMPFDF